MRAVLKTYAVALFVFSFFISAFGYTKDTEPTVVLFENVRVFDGTGSALSAPSNVLVRGNVIERITTDPIPVDRRADTRIIQGEGRTLMPGLIDVHVHMTFGALSMADLMSPDLTPAKAGAAAARNAEETLLRGFTTVRDAGGPIFELKAAIDAGQISGPRIWPSGATVSQTAGHGDFRMPHERSRRFFGEVSRAEQMGATFIADGRDDVLTAVRENLRFGASQIKLMAGGGTSSAYDPIDVTQYTLDEMRAAVEAAEDWGTYVTVHAYTPRAVQRAIEAGVRVIDHGQMLDEETLKMMVEHDVWLSTQVLRSSTPDMDPQRVAKRQPVLEGQARLWPMARDLGVKLAWGTDFLFEPDLNKEQNSYIPPLAEWFSNAEILKLVTHDNAQLLALSGLRSPYSGRLGVVENGALADLLLVDGNPLTDITLLADPESNFVVIMKDGKLVKDTL
ncbi:hydrolase [Aliidiomarina iranensis]|uniref:Hydrolase n=1 Tax=Aliidiomarina iranensis TaxID=1434071 RepID=A0A432VQY0_9GAMM|nr:amidohydrolase family protein [Aliidiomarina iranensis]RUO18511.1 hydrolase [Aliidiomarina iranensis]